MTIYKTSLENVLVDAQIITEAQLKSAQEEKKYSKKTLLEIICSMEFVSKQDLHAQLVSALELYYGVSFFDLTNSDVELDLLNFIPKELLVEYKFLPVKRSGNVFTFAMVEPDNIATEREIKDRLREFKDISIKKVVVLEDDFNKFIEEKFAKQEEKSEIIEQNTNDLILALGVDVVESDLEKVDLSDLTSSAEEAPIIQLANSILGVAISRGVSDIHIEPREKELIVRYRQDGVLSIYKNFPKKIQNALISRYKIMSDLDIAERRLPQDGRIRVRMSNKVIDFRVSTLPGKFGEKVVMRILDKSNIALGLDQLITDKNTLKLVREMINRPYGIIFVTGPTGSGKTTTLYSALSERNKPEVNISTAEDPIEYDLEGITQSEVNKSIGMDFARILRAFLRQDPDIMLVGETRDKETAKIAIEAALTGHLVFTTLHTNDAPSSIMRLSEMEIEPFLISSATIGIVAQRLLRRICSNCKTQYKADDHTIKFLGIKDESLLFYKGSGCEKCNGTGYKGRIGAYEVMKLNDNIRDLIAQGENTAVIKFAAQESGMKTLLEYSLQLAAEGYTTLDEVIRVTFTSEGASSLCPGCGKPVGDEFFKCPFCQYDLKKTCPSCGSFIQDDWISCSKCGIKLLDYKPDTTCHNCGGEISLEMTDCPWCCQVISQK
jgi:type IV pilus assembly protein PilB